MLALLVSGLLAIAIADTVIRYREDVAAVARVQNQVAQNAALDVKQFVVNVERAMQSSAQSAYAVTGGLSASLHTELLGLLKAAPAITTVAALDRDGREVAKISRERLVRDEDLADRSSSIAFQRARTGRDYFGRPYFVRDSEPYISVAVPIEWFGDEVAGVLVAEVSLRKLTDVLSGLRFDGRSYAYVVSDKGDLIAHPDLSLVLRRINLADLAQVQAALAERALPFRSRQNAYGEPVFASYANIDALGWSVLVEQPAPEVLAPLLRSLARSLGFFVVALAIVTAVSILIARRVLGPLGVLYRGAQRIDTGQFDHRIEVTGRDEFAAVAEALSGMAERWNDLYRTLEQQVGERTREISTALMGAATLAQPSSQVIGPPAASFGTESASGANPSDPTEAVVLLERILAGSDVTDPRLLVGLETALCRAYIVAGRPHDAVAAYQRATAGATALNDDSLLFHPRYLITTARAWPELLAVRLDAGRQAFVMAERADQTTDDADHLAALHFLDLVEAGDLTGARAVAETSALRAHKRPGRLPEVIASRMELLLEMQCSVDEHVEESIEALRDTSDGVGLVDAAEVHAVQLLTLRREQGRLGELKPTLVSLPPDHPEAVARGAALALLNCERGVMAEARKEYERWAGNGFDRIPRQDQWLITMAHFSEICACLGDGARALALYELLLPYAGHNIVVPAVCLGSADRYLGMLAAARDGWTAAERHFEDAIAFHDSAAQPIWRAHAQCDLAKGLIIRNGETNRIRTEELLNDALGVATTIGLVKLRERCLALLSRRPSEGPIADGLSQGELRVLRLLASGATNRAIGEKLFLSPHTVANHVRNILAKTNSANRTEAANYARRYSLVADELGAEHN